MAGGDLPSLKCTYSQKATLQDAKSIPPPPIFFFFLPERNIFCQICSVRDMSCAPPTLCTSLSTSPSHCGRRGKPRAGFESLTSPAIRLCNQNAAGDSSEGQGRQKKSQEALMKLHGSSRASGTSPAAERVGGPSLRAHAQGAEIDGLTFIFNKVTFLIILAL